MLFSAHVWYSKTRDTCSNWNQGEVDLECSWIEKDNQGNLVDITEDKNSLMERMVTYRSQQTFSIRKNSKYY